MVSPNPYCPHCQALAAELARVQLELQTADAVLRSLPSAVAEAVTRALGDVHRDYLAHAGTGTPGRAEQRVVQQLNAARAQCYRRKLSDAARRTAVDKARMLGALPADFDDSVLPWSWKTSAPAATVPATPASKPTPTRVSKPGPDAVAAKLLTLAVAIPEASHPGYGIFIAARLARLAGKWPSHRAPLTKAWRAAFGAARHDEPVFDVGSPSANYPDDTPAVTDGSWTYPGGAVARRHDNYYYPNESARFVDASSPARLRPTWTKIVARARRVLDKNLVARIEDRLEEIDVSLVPLALMELERAVRVAEVKEQVTVEAIGPKRKKKSKTVKRGKS